MKNVILYNKGHHNHSLSFMEWANVLAQCLENEPFSKPCERLAVSRTFFWGGVMPFHWGITAIEKAPSLGPLKWHCFIEEIRSTPTLLDQSIS